MTNTFNAVVAYARSDSDTWYQGTNAYQGAYADQKPRVGVLMFSSLRSSVAWQDMAVKSVSLYLDYGTAGAARRKTIGLYATSRNSIGGEGIDMLGASFGQFYTSVSTYGNDETVVFNETTNAALFAKMAQWIENGTTNGIALYVNETTTGSNSYSTNFLNVIGATITVEYEVKGSKGILNPTSVDVGAAVNLTIEPIESEYVVSHTVEWVFGSLSSGVKTLAGGVTETAYTIPYSWMDEMPGEVSADAVCVLTTYENGAKKAERQIAFEVTIPQSFAPVINSFAVQRYAGVIGDSGETVYEASLSGANVWVSCDLSIDTASGNNAGSAYIRYYPADDEASAQETALAWGGEALSLSNDMAVIPGTFELGQAYVFELHATNGHYSAVKTARVEKSWAPFHIAGTGYGIGLGMYSNGTQEKPGFDVAWRGNFYSGSSGLFDVVYDSGVQTKSSANSSETTQLSYTVEEDGVYMVIGRGSFPTGTGGAYRFMAIKYGATGTENELTAQTNPPQSSAGPRTSCMGIEQLTAGQVVTLRFNQNSGAAVNIIMRMWVVKIGGQYAS